MKRPFVITCLALQAIAFLAVSPAAEAATTESCPVVFASGPPPEPEGPVPGGRATLIRNEDGIGLSINTRHLPGAGPVTVWMFFINADGTRVNGPIFGTSDLVTRNGRAHFGIGVSESADGLVDAETDRVHALVLHHGDVNPDLIHEQLTIPGGGGPPNPVQLVLCD